jgi:hypothetical protein
MRVRRARARARVFLYSFTLSKLATVFSVLLRRTLLKFHMLKDTVHFDRLGTFVVFARARACAHVRLRTHAHVRVTQA